MIELYAWGTGNGQRGAIACEESGLPYHLTKVDLTKGEQRTPEFLARNPMGQIPVMVDSDGPGGMPVTLSQSGAILLYLARKSGKFIPKDAAQEAKALEWMMNACTDIAVTSGSIAQLTIFAKEKHPPSVEHFENRLANYFRVCDQQLQGKDYLLGEITVADLALYPVVNARKPLIEKTGGLSNLVRWAAKMGERPGIQRAMKHFA